MTDEKSQIVDEVYRAAFIRAVFNLNEEGFNYVAWGIYQTSKTAGGFTDHEGWLRVREAAEKIPYIAKIQAEFDKKYEEADKIETVVVPIDKAKG